MSQCPLGFKGTPPPGHPKVAGLDTTSSASDATNAATSASSSTSEKTGWNPWLLLVIDAAFILVAIYLAKNGVPKAIADPVRAALNKTQRKVNAKTE
ncbi:uncharacterized protein UMAG_12211 [Mycosarcoma maydis]|uniref:Uncharacterized protein n=1 Tax=Mycosarcoma maydis TaxID=5270 RepID=A0A0D1DWN6_MYCMD|nr:uncharacterized protein UMAG_12211 [Ustilago maydis 521]KIS68579.1 hypothetical protein UMAG_12211 [Ustilago maydis 521]|eukprot:XP_011389848.1 hypothetical protein UMAG_12211 [Ustilago maydis 521]